MFDPTQLCSHTGPIRIRTALLLALILLSMVAPSRALSQKAAGDEPVEVIIMLRDQAQSLVGDDQPQGDRASRARSVVSALHSKADSTQPALLRSLKKMQSAGEIQDIRPLWVINAVAVTARPDVLDELALLPEVARISPDYPLRLAGPAAGPSAAQSASMVSNLLQIRAPHLWASGYTGRDIVVANLDTGVSLNNADLAARWRGGDNSWLDVHGEHAAPTDQTGGYSGHGTGTMSIMVGEDTGVAPGAQWIAVKLFSDSGYASFSDAVLAYEWLLDPDGDPTTADAPHVVNNSWTMSSTGCFDDPALHQAFQSLLAADILPVFAAGNYGYAASPSDTSPGNYIEALAVGSINHDLSISYFSSRGPTSCRGGEQVFPDLVAPGGNVPLQSVIGTRDYNSGTSFAAPHAAGALALLLDAFPGLTAEQQRQALTGSASDLGLSGADNAYGSGTLDVYSAYLSLGGKPLHRTVFHPIIR